MTPPTSQPPTRAVHVLKDALSFHYAATVLKHGSEAAAVDAIRRALQAPEALAYADDMLERLRSLEANLASHGVKLESRAFGDSVAREGLRKAMVMAAEIPNVEA